jgi:hypothetical protein
VALALEALLTGCTGAGGPAPPTPPASTPSTSLPASSPAPSPTERFATFDDGVVRFRYPASWGTRTYRGLYSHFTDPLVFLSTEPMHSPCEVHRTEHSRSSVCGLPVRRLPPPSILVSWWASGFLGWTLAGAEGTRTRVGGLPAKIQERGDVCRRIPGVDRAIQAHVRSTATSTACSAPSTSRPEGRCSDGPWACGMARRRSIPRSNRPWYRGGIASGTAEA